MIEWLLDLPALALFVTLGASYAASAALIFWLAFRSPLRARIGTLGGVVAPFFGSVSVLFALLTGFLAGDVGDRNRHAVRAVQAERDAALNLYTLSVASVSEMSDIRETLRAYISSVVTDEWPRMSHYEPSAPTDEALAGLVRAVSDPKHAREAGAAVHNALLNTTIRLSTSRSERLALNEDRTNNVKWATVLILALLTQIAIGLVHIERPRAHAAAMTVFSIAVAVTLSLIALQENPFDGPLRVSSAPIESALKTIVAGQPP